MKTKFIPKKTRCAILLLLFSLVVPACNRQSEIKSPDETLIEKLSDRLEKKDYVSSRSTNNPYDQTGRDAVEFRKFISTDAAFRKQIRLQNSTKLGVVHAGLFQLTSVNSEKNWGIEDPNVLKLIKSKSQEFDERNGKEFDGSRIDKINDELLLYSKDTDGVNKILENGFSKKAISKVQYEILKMTVSQISKADVREANSINATVEHEVINSSINDADKAMLLSINSLLANDFEDQLSHLPDFDQKSTVFRKTAQALIVVGIAIAVGAAVGAINGTIVCCGLQNNNCKFACVSGYIDDGARLGIGFGLGLIK
jgi:hypothetical protein